jgi:hypothetical protein
VAAGDIPHQDPSWLNFPLMQQGGDVAKQLLQQSSPALANALASRSFGNLADNGGLSANALQNLAHLGASQKKRKIDELNGVTDQGDNTKR